MVNLNLGLIQGLLRADPREQAYLIAHELVHGLSLAELHNPTKSGYVEAFNNLRGKLIGAMNPRMRAAASFALESDWYGKWSRS